MGLDIKRYKTREDKKKRKKENSKKVKR